jgi:hypothetical protein
MNYQIIYKACVQDPVTKQWRSIIRAKTSAVTYPLNDLVRPKSGDNQFLFGFDSHKNAEHFAKGMKIYHNRAIFQAVGVNVRKKAKTVCGNVALASSFPQGTVFCDSMLLLKKVATLPKIKSIYDE